MDSATWLIIGNILCLIPMAILFIQYVIRTRWQNTETGRALAWLIILSSANFGLNFLGNITDHPVVVILRVISKFLIALGLWNLLRVIEKARNEKIDAP